MIVLKIISKIGIDDKIISNIFNTLKSFLTYF